jgi:clan AA aspartic protease (TIGR02281 family)
MKPMGLLGVWRVPHEWVLVGRSGSAPMFDSRASSSRSGDSTRTGLALALAASLVAAAGAAQQQRSAVHLRDLQSREVVLESEGGTFVVPVVINNAITLKFTIDSGAADVSIPSDVVSMLVRKGTLSSRDFIGSRIFVLADGSKVASAEFRIRSVQIGDITLNNVVGAISDAKGSLLLGQSFLARLSSWSIDNDRHVLLMKGPGGSASPLSGMPSTSATPKEPEITAASPYPSDQFHLATGKIAGTWKFALSFPGGSARLYCDIGEIGSHFIGSCSGALRDDFGVRTDIARTYIANTTRTHDIYSWTMRSPLAADSRIWRMDGRIAGKATSGQLFVRNIGGDDKPWGSFTGHRIP